MKEIKGFSEYTYKPLLESNFDNELILEELNIGKYQRSIKKFYKETGIQLHYALTFGTALTVLLPVIEKFMNTGEFLIEATTENVVMLTIFAVAILTNESKDKIEKLYTVLIEKGIKDVDINKVINQLKNIKIIFANILKASGKVVSSFVDMLAYSGILIPFLAVISSLIDNGRISSELFSQSFKTLHITMGAVAIKLLIQKILHKLDKITTTTGKFQNKENIKPLIVNDEFKSPAFKTDRKSI